MSGLGVAAIYMVGLALLIGDVFVGSTKLAILGVIALATALFGAFWVGGPLIGGSLAVTTGALTLFVLRTGLRRMTHRDAQSTSLEDGYVASPTSLAALQGQRGVAETPLRPAGFARIGGKRIDVVTRGEMLDVGAAIEVIQVEGARVVVKVAT